MSRLEENKKRLLDLMSDSNYKPMKAKEIATLFMVPKEDREHLRAALDSLTSSGRIIMDRDGRYEKKEREILQGIFRLNPKGFGFVTVEGFEDDFHVSAASTMEAMNGDTVKIQYKRGPEGKSFEAKVVEIVEHAIDTVVGVYQASETYGFVVCDDVRITRDIFIPYGNAKGAVTGHKVVVKITDYGNDRKKPEGEVVEILGHVNDPGVDIMSIVKGMSIPCEFPEKVLAQANTVSKPVSEADRAGRKDLRKLVCVTIDGDDSKDLDDAVSLEKDGENYILGVHIADVANYVQEGSALDKEALKRSTSVYLVDRVIPMLPHTLSNGICSLNEGEDRLTLSCIMTIDKNGKLIDHEICESVINSNHRMTYHDVNEILENHNEELIEKYKDVSDMFFEMEKLAHLLRRNRKQRGSIDFESKESKIKLDESGKPVSIELYERGESNMVIEDFMLMANETVAEHFYWLESPFLYRIHEVPSEDKIRELGDILANLGYTFRASGNEISSKEVQKMLSFMEGKPEEAMITKLTLRSMQQAKYSNECKGHFGLAAPYYSHFTSPIRRYPDLQIHRIIKDHLRGRFDDKKAMHYDSILPQVASRTSELERRSDEAERETEKLKKVEFMEPKVGQEFTGVISGVTSWGIYVELPNTVEGLVHISKLKGDYYRYIEESFELVGERKNVHYKLGQTVNVILDSADTQMRVIDFSLKE